MLWESHSRIGKTKTEGRVRGGRGVRGKEERDFTWSLPQGDSPWKGKSLRTAAEAVGKVSRLCY